MSATDDLKRLAEADYNARLIRLRGPFGQRQLKQFLDDDTAQRKG